MTCDLHLGLYYYLANSGFIITLTYNAIIVGEMNSHAGCDSRCKPNITHLGIYFSQTAEVSGKEVLLRHNACHISRFSLEFRKSKSPLALHCILEIVDNATSVLQDAHHQEPLR